MRYLYEGYYHQVLSVQISQDGESYCVLFAERGSRATIHTLNRVAFREQVKIEPVTYEAT